MTENLDTLKVALFANNVEDFNGYSNFVNLKLEAKGGEYFINFHDEGQLVIDTEQGFYFAGKWKEEAGVFTLIGVQEQVSNANPVQALEEFIFKITN
jgi:hypothetical protein